MSTTGKLPPEDLAGIWALSRTPVPVRILVVEDDAGILRLNASVLRRFGYLAETAENGAIAWEALMAKEYDLLITDHDMPKVTGLELVRKVRSARLTLPVLIASGALPDEVMDQNTWLQPFATLAKPFSMSQLLDKVNEILEPPPPATLSPMLEPPPPTSLSPD